MSGRHDDEALAAGIRAMDESWLFTEPGKIHSYANPGYWIAGLACEVVEGKPYADVMEQRLFRPLGMTRTTLRPTLAMTWPLALGHEVRDGEASIVRPQADNAGTWPAGQMYSSVVDLARFTTAFMDGGKLDGQQVLSPTLIAALSGPHVPRPGSDGHYGHGLQVSTQRGVRVWQHGGSRTGYGSTIAMAPDQKIAVIILTNRSAMGMPRTTAAAIDMLLPFEPRPTPSERSRQPLTESDIAELVGVYTNHRQTIELTAEDGKLVARRLGGESPSDPSFVNGFGENRISLSHSGGEFFIVRDAAGRPEYLVAGSRAFRRRP
jgi:CubicO group peptidase (beta-lactamase class C family)